MNCNSLYYSPMYNLGLIPATSTNLRESQGLLPQTISSICVNALPVQSSYVNYGPYALDSCPCVKLYNSL